MPRSQRILQQDTPCPDGMLFFGVGDIVVANGSGTTAITRVASGEWSIRCSGTTATELAVPLTGALQRYGMQDDLQELYGSARAGGSNGLPVGWPTTLSSSNASAGASVSVSVLSTVNFFAGQYVLVDTSASGVQEYTQIISISSATAMVMNLANSHTSPFPIVGNVFTTPAGVSGSPPYTGYSELTPVTSPRPKGMLLKQITPIYAINTTNITTNTIGVTAMPYTNAVTVPSATVILTNAANNLSTTAASTPYVTPIPIPVASQVWQNTRNTSWIIEWDVTAASTGSVDVLGVLCDVSFNYN